MARIAYVNGRYVPHRAASVHVEDRGYQFADGVYEVCEVRGGKLVDERRHMERLERSLEGTAHRHADAAQRARRGVARNSGTQPRAQRHRLSAGHAWRCAPRPCVSGARHAAKRRGDRTAAIDLATIEAGQPTGSRSSPCRRTAGRAWTSSRCRCCRTCSPSRRRASRAPRRPGSSIRRQGDRGLILERLDRHARRQRWSRGRRIRHPARHHPHSGARRDQGARASSSKSVPSRWRRPMRRARHSSPRRPVS